MSMEEAKPKSKKAKKLRKEKKIIDETQNKEHISEAANYVAGEVASSLFSKKPGETVTPLFSLFGTKASAVQPTYVPVKTLKRKLPEPDNTKKDATKVNQEVANKTKTKKEKELSESEKRLANREQSLANADEEENTKQYLSKQRQTSKKTQKIDDNTGLLQPPKKIINKAEERIKNKRTVFVGNLPVDCTKKMLMSLFKEYGPIESVRFRSVARAEPNISRKAATILRKVNPKRNNINAYVVFKEESSASNAIKRNGDVVGNGFHIRVDLATKSNSHDNKRSAFVGNLPYDIDEESVRKHFSECGKVESVRIVRDKDSGIGKGFCFVLFQDIDSVHLALKLNNSELLGRKVRVKRAASETSGKIPNKNKNKSFKEKLNNLKQTKPHQKKSFAGETFDNKTKKNKVHKNMKKRFDRNKKTKFSKV